jgi:hypothetical protein
MQVSDSEVWYELSRSAQKSRNRQAKDKKSLGDPRLDIAQGDMPTFRSHEFVTLDDVVQARSRRRPSDSRPWEYCRCDASSHGPFDKVPVATLTRVRKNRSSLTGFLPYVALLVLYIVGLPGVGGNGQTQIQGANKYLICKPGPILQMQESHANSLSACLRVSKPCSSGYPGDVPAMCGQNDVTESSPRFDEGVEEHDVGMATTPPSRKGRYPALHLRGGAHAVMEEGIEHVSECEEDHGWRGRKSEHMRHFAQSARPGAHDASFCVAQQPRFVKDMQGHDQGMMAKVIADMLVAGKGLEGAKGAAATPIKKASSMYGSYHAPKASVQFRGNSDDSFHMDISVVSASRDTSNDELQGQKGCQPSCSRDDLPLQKSTVGVLASEDKHASSRLSRPASMPGRVAFSSQSRSSSKASTSEMVSSSTDKARTSASRLSHTDHVEGSDIAETNQGSHAQAPRYLTRQTRTENSFADDLPTTAPADACVTNMQSVPLPAHCNGEDTAVSNSGDTHSHVASISAQESGETGVGICAHTTSVVGAREGLPTPTLASHAESSIISPETTGSDIAEHEQAEKERKAKAQKSKRREEKRKGKGVLHKQPSELLRASSSERVWGADGSPEALECMACKRHIGGGCEWFMAYDKRHCSVECAQVSARKYDEEHPPAHEAEPTATYLCTQT